MNLKNALNTLYEQTTWKGITELEAFLKYEAEILPKDSSYYQFYETVLQAIIQRKKDRVI